MAAALPILFTVGKVAAVGSTIYGGISAAKSARREAEAQRQQGLLAKQEADEEAQRTAKEQKRFRALKKVAYLKNGVRLTGSPILSLENDAAEQKKEVDAIKRRGSAQQNLYNQRASNTRRSGRAALIGGLTGGLNTAATGIQQGRELGFF